MSEEAWEWTAESDVLLFKAMKGIRPVGVDKHFQMLQILSKWYALLDAKRDALLNEATSNRIEVGSTAQQRHERLAGLDRLRARDLWQRMGTYYDLDGLDELENDFYIPCSKRSSARTSQCTSRASSLVPSTAEVSTPGQVATKREGNVSPSVAINEAIAILSPSKNSPERIANVTKQQKVSGSPQKSAHHSFRRLARKGLHASRQYPMASFQKVPWKYWPPQQVKDFFLWPDAEFGPLLAERRKQMQESGPHKQGRKRGRPAKQQKMEDEEGESDGEEEADEEEEEEEDDGEETGGPPDAMDFMLQEGKRRSKGPGSSARSTRTSSRRSSPPPASAETELPATSGQLGRPRKHPATETSRVRKASETSNSGAVERHTKLGRPRKFPKVEKGPVENEVKEEEKAEDRKKGLRQRQKSTNYT